jgi:hypothetical protein
MPSSVNFVTKLVFYNPTAVRLTIFGRATRDTRQGSQKFKGEVSLGKSRSLDGFSAHRSRTEGKYNNHGADENVRVKEGFGYVLLFHVEVCVLQEAKTQKFMFPA